MWKRMERGRGVAAMVCSTCVVLASDRAAGVECKGGLCTCINIHAVTLARDSD